MSLSMSNYLALYITFKLNNVILKVFQRKDISKHFRELDKILIWGAKTMSILKVHQTPIQASNILKYMLKRKHRPEYYLLIFETKLFIFSLNGMKFDGT